MKKIFLVLVLLITSSITAIAEPGESGSDKKAKLSPEQRLAKIQAKKSKIGLKRTNFLQQMEVKEQNIRKKLSKLETKQELSDEEKAKLEKLKTRLSNLPNKRKERLAHFEEREAKLSKREKKVNAKLTKKVKH